MQRTTLSLLLAFALTLFSINDSLSQDRWWKDKKYKSESAKMKYELCKKTFKDIGYGFSMRNINFINLYFDSQVYLNVISNEKGYYSSNQAELILQDFMEYFVVENFRYLRSSRYNTYAFVNGIYTYTIGSGRRDLQATISLKYYNNRWYIDQININ